MNMLAEFLQFEKNSITLFAKEVLSSDYYEEEAFSKLLNTYIDNRYFNYYSDEDTSFEDRIFAHLRKTVVKLSEGTDEATKIKLAEMFTVFNYVLCLDGVKTLRDSTFIRIVCEYHKILYGNEDNKLFKESLIKLVKRINDKREEFFKLFDTKDFGIQKYSTSKNNVVDIELTYNISFPKLYSDYAIDRVFNSDVIAEDKLLVLYYLMTSMIIKDLKSCIFDRYYLLDFAPSLFEDKQRLDKLLNLTKNDCFKSQTIFKVTYKDYAKYGNNIRELVKDGYMFALKLDDEVDKSEYMIFEIFTYIIVDKDTKKLKAKEIVINDR